MTSVLPSRKSVSATSSFKRERGLLLCIKSRVANVHLVQSRQGQLAWVWIGGRAVGDEEEADDSRGGGEDMEVERRAHRLDP